MTIQDWMDRPETHLKQQLVASEVPENAVPWFIQNGNRASAHDQDAALKAVAAAFALQCIRERRQEWPT